jgi:hypothetical protein
MLIVYVVTLYVKYFTRSEAIIRHEYRYFGEPPQDIIEKIVNDFKPSSYDYEIDYSTGAVLPDYSMPKKCKIESVYATVEKRYYREDK